MGLKNFSRKLAKSHYYTDLKIAQSRLFSPALVYLRAKRFFLGLLLAVVKVRKHNYGPRTIKPKYLRVEKDRQALKFPKYQNTAISILVIDHRNHDYTYNCLRSILLYTSNVAYEVVLLTARVNLDYDWLTEDSGIRVEKISGSGQNLGHYVTIAAPAKPFICLVENNTQLTDGWMKNILTVFDNNHDAGLVGIKVLYSSGLLKEAGSEIDTEGRKIAQGRFKDPNNFKYNFLEEVETCSASCFVFKKADFLALSASPENLGLQTVDELAFLVRNVLRKKVFYQPLSVQISFEMPTEGAPENIIFSQRQSERRSILVIDSVLPKPDQDSGSRRLFEILKIFKELELKVYFLNHDGTRAEPYYSNLINSGVRVLSSIHPGESHEEKLQEVLPTVNFVWISRPDMNEYYGPLVKAIKDVPWIYDTVDLHFLRLQRAFLLSGLTTEEVEHKVEAIRRQELKLAGAASLTVTVTDTEKQILEQLGIKHVAIIPNVHPEVEHNSGQLGFEARKDIVFIGSYEHQPNVDAAKWLVNNIMPRVWSNSPDIKLYLLGSKPTPDILALQSKYVIVPGFIPDVSSYFTNARVFVAPLRYGAGMKGKIGQSLEYGLPIVSTNIGIEGMGLTDGVDVLIADDADLFADKIMNLYSSEALWNMLRLNSKLVLMKYSPEKVTENIKTVLQQLTLKF